MPKVNAELEMEEGEIIDELDDLSDISSEEEFLLRQRLEVLENYNTVLERKKAKRSSLGSGTKPKRDVLCDLSEVPETEFQDSHTHAYKHIVVQRHVKPYNKQKRKKDLPYVDENNVRRKKENHKKKTSRSKKKLSVKVISESSDESEDEYKNKRQKLAEAVIVHRPTDKSSLSARLHKMIHWSEGLLTNGLKKSDPVSSSISNHINKIEQVLSSKTDDPIGLDVTDSVQRGNDNIDIRCIEVSDDEVEIVNEFKNKDAKCEVEALEKDSDEDLELLRQHALKSKFTKAKAVQSSTNEQKHPSEEEDSDTAELRLICLKSALLKKAIEIKQKSRKTRKRFQSSNLEDDCLNGNDMFPNKDEGNNTDIEIVDMDMESDADEKIKDGENDKRHNGRLRDSDKNDLINYALDNINSASKEDELDDDEDLLRARLLTSLSKNLTNLVSPEVLSTFEELKKVKNSTPHISAKTVDAPEAKKFIIKLGESDSEGEHEATKNLTKMHMKLSEQIDFQEKLDMFLKSTRMEVEKKKLPDGVTKLSPPKKTTKFVAKTVSNLPKSEQIEYKNLVKRMAELEKMKKTRQAALNLLNQQQQELDTKKQRNVTIETQPINSNLEEQIAKSRKTIAEESVKMLKLKEEATNLLQRYKIAATELRNISTAITLNKRQQKSIQLSLSKIRLQHQSLLKSSTTSLHSKINGRVPHFSHHSSKPQSAQLQKEINPKDEYKDPLVQKTVKISVVNDFVDKTVTEHPKLSVKLDETSKKRIVMRPKSPDTKVSTEVNHDIEKVVEILDERNRRLSGDNDDHNLTENKEEECVKPTELVAVCDHGNTRYYISVDDYKSPLDALGTTTWLADPNAILCPFEVGGHCKDPDCKYLHTPTPAQ